MYPTTSCLKLEELNDDFDKTQSEPRHRRNTLVNPAALEDEGCPIYGMPAAEVWNSERTVVFKEVKNRAMQVSTIHSFIMSEVILFGDASDSMSNSGQLGAKQVIVLMRLL